MTGLRLEDVAMLLVKALRVQAALQRELEELNRKLGDNAHARFEADRRVNELQATLSSLALGKDRP